MEDSLPDNIYKKFKMFWIFVKTSIVLFIAMFLEDIIAVGLGRETDWPYWKIGIILIPLILVFSWIITKIGKGGR